MQSGPFCCIIILNNTERRASSAETGEAPVLGAFVVVKGAIVMAGPDLSRNTELKGQTVKQGDYAVTYDDRGYAVKATNTKHELFKDPGYDGKYAGGNFGFTDGTPNYWSEENPGYGGVNYRGGGGGGVLAGGNAGYGGGGGSYSKTYGDYEPTDLSGYLSAIYAAQTQAQISALKSAYEQNLAGLQAQADKIPETYQAARNEAASQNDIARLAFQEYANARGMNTGTSGQAALANSSVLQSNLTDIASQESNALAENALQQEQLAAEYRNAAAQAQAQGNSQLAQALYSEYVRQDDAAFQMAQLAQEQANWQASFDTANQQWAQQFGASQREYQDSLAAQDREYAYNLAMTMLGAGIMPDSGTLSAAGISSQDALSMRLAAAGTSSGGGGSRSSRSSVSSGGNRSTENEYVTAGPGINSDTFQNQLMALSSYLSRASGSRLNSQSYRDNQLSAAQELYDSLWDQANEEQRNRLNALAASYGLS